MRRRIAAVGVSCSAPAALVSPGPGHLLLAGTEGPLDVFPWALFLGQYKPISLGSYSSGEQLVSRELPGRSFMSLKL